jgi:flagellar basal-body rod modification protein FlgD
MIDTTTQTENRLFTELDTQPKTRVPKKVLDRDDFMLLFIKQLEYQDPLKPLENNEMATQLALFNQVDQLFDLNEKFSQMVEIAKGNVLSTMASLIGKKALAESELARVENGHFLGGKLVLEEPVEGIRLKIYSSEGSLVREVDLGALPAGEHEIDWDATNEQGETVPDGTYRLYLETSNPEDRSLVTIKTVGRLTGALLEGEDYQLLFNGQSRLSLSDLEKILAEEE